jgi:hypothetical protein
MTKETYDYTVKCGTCRKPFVVQMFDSHEKNLFMVDNRKWFCEACKKEYFKKQAADLTEEHKSLGFPALSGTQKQISWAVKIRSELINKVDYLRQSLTFNSEEDKSLSDQAFEMFLREWQEIKDAKWWIDNRQTTVRDVSRRVAEISGTLKNEGADSSKE